jgi:hypothetical protein
MRFCKTNPAQTASWLIAFSKRAMRAPLSYFDCLVVTNVSTFFTLGDPVAAPARRLIRIHPSN